MFFSFIICKRKTVESWAKKFSNLKSLSLSIVVSSNTEFLDEISKILFFEFGVIFFSTFPLMVTPLANGKVIFGGFAIMSFQKYLLRF